MNNPTVIYRYDYAALPDYTVSYGRADSWFTPHLSLKQARHAYNKAAGIRTFHWIQTVAIALIAFGLGGAFGPLSPMLRLESELAVNQATTAVRDFTIKPTSMPPSVPLIYEPLKTPDGASIKPVSEEFSVIVPKVGINAKVIKNVDPGVPADYLEALKGGVAHAKTSFLPDEDGTVYLFSHSTNYDWFVEDLNAVFYHLKNIEAGDSIVLVYKNRHYTYQITGKQVVKPTDVNYLVPRIGSKNLILQTCWPPGSVAERLLIFADLVDETGKTI